MCPIGCIFFHTCTMSSQYIISYAITKINKYISNRDSWCSWCFCQGFSPNRSQYIAHTIYLKNRFKMSIWSKSQGPLPLNRKLKITGDLPVTRASRRACWTHWFCPRKEKRERKVRLCKGRERFMHDRSCADDGSGMPLPLRPTQILREISSWRKKQGIEGWENCAFISEDDVRAISPLNFIDDADARPPEVALRS